MALRAKSSDQQLSSVGVARSVFVTNTFRVFAALHCLLAFTTSAVGEAVVAKDGSGDFRTVQEAVDAAPDGRQVLHVIRIKPGIYREVVTVSREKGPIKFLGEDALRTVITFGNSAKTLDAKAEEIGTSRSATVFIESDMFSAENITFENSFGQGIQALAINVQGDRQVFRKCRFLGWQDTVLLKRGRQYFEDCYFAGDVDIIFGGSTAFFNRCQIHLRDEGYITAASTPENHPHGFVFSHCRITAESDDVSGYLGRPWRPFASVAFIDTEMPAAIRSERWDSWGNPENEKTARFSERGSAGPGGDMAARVGWSQVLTEREAETMTVYRVLGQWDPRHALSFERIHFLPEEQRRAWEAYVQRSAERQARDRAVLAAELAELQREQPTAPPSGEVFKLPNNPPSTWFQLPETRTLADAAISFQTPSGGWSKNVALDKGPRQPGMHWSAQATPAVWHYVGTFDNRSTTEHLRLLAGVYTATKTERYRDAFLKGLDYVLEAQFPNGGWPQGYPLEGGYHDFITFNDDAFIHILELLRDIAERDREFDFVDTPRVKRAEQAFEAGLQCVLEAQVIRDGKLAVWCAQHDPIGLEPVPARLQEPASLSGGESVGIVKFLMTLPNPSDNVVKAVDHALSWFEQSRLTGLRKTKRDGRTYYKKDPDSIEPLWARFYDLETNQPIYPGARDGILYDTFLEMWSNNDAEYDFLTDRPKELLTKQTVKWRKKLQQ